VTKGPGNLITIALKITIFARAGLQYSCNFFSNAGLFGYAEFHFKGLGSGIKINKKGGEAAFKSSQALFSSQSGLIIYS
jgi:hypothetical protein